MVEITLTNTRTRTKEVLVPLNPDDVRMYLCGPTVYDRAHLGNARPVVVFDVLYRLLRHVYGEDHVSYVRNFTDVDDKINAAALARQQAGDPRRLEDLIRERTIQTIGWYHDDMDALGALRPSIRGAVSDRAEPRATDYVPQMIAMIEDLVAKGHAYAAQGHVLFDVRSFPAYGRLSGRSIDDMIAGARVEVAPFKRDPMDFVLWKPSSAAEPGWDSPWGRGRPGWHIECSAMSAALLGDSFDIHAGGIDLQFPHHENEIAQSCCAHPKAEFAKVWLHNEMLQVEGKKMSKSLGNFFTVRDLLDQGVPGEVIRYVFLMTHYRDVMDYSKEKVSEAKSFFSSFRQKFGSCKEEISALRLKNPHLREELARWFEKSNFFLAICDDLNTPLAISSLHAMLSRGEPRDLLRISYCLEFVGLAKSFERVRANFRRGLSLLLNSIDDGAGLGASAADLVDEVFKLTYLKESLPNSEIQSSLFQASANTSFTQVASAFSNNTPEEIYAIIHQRNLAKSTKNYSLADAYRKQLRERGIELMDRPDGTKWRALKNDK